MNFERHKAVLEATKIGIEANAPDIHSIWANTEGGSTGIKDTVIPEFLERLVKNIFPDQTFAEYYISLLFPYPKDGSPWESIKLNELRGTYVKYKNKFYKIPDEL